MRGRRTTCSSGARSGFLRAAYLAGLVLALSALYSCGDSALFLRDEWGRATRDADKGVEALVWAAAVAAAAAYFFVQGSSPGYVKRARRAGTDGAGSLGSEVAELAAALPAGEAKRAGAQAPTAAAAAMETALALEAAEVVVEAPLESVQRPAVSASQRVQRALPEVGVAHGSAAAGLGSLLAEPTDFTPPEPGADPAAVAAVDADASEAARAGVRECEWCHVLQPRRAHHCRACNAW
jgi:hypothetical protein